MSPVVDSSPPSQLATVNELPRSVPRPVDTRPWCRVRIPRDKPDRSVMSSLIDRGTHPPGGQTYTGKSTSTSQHVGVRQIRCDSGNPLGVGSTEVGHSRLSRR